MLGERKQRVVLTPKMYRSINQMISNDKKTKEIVEFHKDEFDLSKSSVLKIMREIFDCDDFNGLLEKVENRASGRELKENKMVLKRRELIKESLYQDGSNTLKKLQNLLESNGIYVSQTTIKTDIEKMNFRRKRLKNGNLIWVPNDNETIDIEDEEIIEEYEGDLNEVEVDSDRMVYFRRITFSLPKNTPYLFSITKKAIEQVEIVTLIMALTKREIVAHKTFSGPLSSDILNSFLKEDLVPKMGEGQNMLFMESADAMVDVTTGLICRQNQIQIKAMQPSSPEFNSLERFDVYVHSKYAQISEKTVENVIKSLDEIVAKDIDINTALEAYQ